MLFPLFIVSREYDKPPIHVTENGVCDNTEPAEGAVEDTGRIELLAGFLAGLAAAIRDGAANVRSYYLWSLLDNFEWAFGYKMRFGIVGVDRESQERTIKPSARWLSEVVKTNTLS